jgi:hypothetical protein
MRKILILLGLALAAGTAQAQIKCWTDASGKRTCGDTPPPGAKVTTLKGPASGPGPAPEAKDSKNGKDAKKGPLTPAEQEQEYRKRRAEAEKAGAQADKDKQAADAKKENCERAKEYLSSLEAGGRIPRTDAKGERYYLDEKQVEQEKAKARQVAQQSCS